MLSRLAVVATLVASFFIIATPTAHADGDHRIWVCQGKFDKSCQWVIVDSDGTVQSDGGSLPGTSWSSSDAVSVPDPCIYRQADDQPPPGDPAWGSHDPSQGRLWVAHCPDTLKVASWNKNGDNVIGSWTVGDPYWVSDSSTPDEAYVGTDPMILVYRAGNSFDLPLPDPSFGPDPGELAVKVPIWLSVPAFPEVSQTASAGRYTATVTATLAETEWQPGEATDADRGDYRPMPAKTCAGPGVAYQNGMDRLQPPCSYTYTWRSLKARTDGLGAWTMRIISRYQIAYTVTDTAAGAVLNSGTDQTETSVRALLTLREWRGVLGDSDYATPEITQIYPEIIPDR